MHSDAIWPWSLYFFFFFLETRELLESLLTIFDNHETPHGQGPCLFRLASYPSAFHRHRQHSLKSLNESIHWSGVSQVCFDFWDVSWANCGKDTQADCLSYLCIWAENVSYSSWGKKQGVGMMPMCFRELKGLQALGRSGEFGGDGWKHAGEVLTPRPLLLERVLLLLILKWMALMG